MWVNLVEMGIQPSEIANISYRQYLTLLIAKKELEEQQGEGEIKTAETPEQLARLLAG